MSNDPIVYPYIPNSVPDIKRRMLEEIGAAGIEDLYAEIPSHLRFEGPLNLPEPILDEASIKRHVEQLLRKNRNCSEHLSFLGAGCARHYVPAACDEINNRAEFLTAYVGESYADHGKWQAFFEYASLMGDLLEMDVLSCPLYDGPQAAATSLRMASRITGRRQVLLPGSMGEETLSVQGILEVYFRLEAYLKEISGLDHFSFQPGGGAQGVYANACMVRAFHEARGDEQRSEIITTLFSHPCDAASPATAGYKVITLMPDESGYPDLEATRPSPRPMPAWDIPPGRSEWPGNWVGFCRSPG